MLLCEHAAHGAPPQSPAVRGGREGPRLWVGGYLYLTHSVSRTPKPPGIRELSATDGGEVREVGGTNAAADITHSGSHSFLFREGGRAVGGAVS